MAATQVPIAQTASPGRGAFLGTLGSLMHVILVSAFLMFTKKALQPSGSKCSDCLWARLLSTRGNPPSSSSSSSPYLAHEGHRARPRQQPGVLFLRPNRYHRLWRSSNRSTNDPKGCCGTMVSVRWKAIERKTLLGCDYLVSVFLSLSSLAPAKLSLLSVLPWPSIEECPHLTNAHWILVRFLLVRRWAHDSGPKIAMCAYGFWP